MRENITSKAKKWRKTGSKSPPFHPNPATLYPKHPTPGELPARIGMELPLQGSQEQAQLHPFPWGATLGREDRRGGWEAYFFRPLCQDWSPFEGKGQRKQERGSSSQWHCKNLRKNALKGKEYSWLPCSYNSSLSQSGPSMSQLNTRATWHY